mmetsp:Transcript_15967/g.50049  ORF Transcript_15967/g.50049 Transcript_15967/m.50049 type:complete len:418 (+) Transcript_15967:1085-2338(+)
MSVITVGRERAPPCTRVARRGLRWHAQVTMVRRRYGAEVVLMRLRHVSLIAQKRSVVMGRDVVAGVVKVRVRVDGLGPVKDFVGAGEVLANPGLGLMTLERGGGAHALLDATEAPTTRGLGGFGLGETLDGFVGGHGRRASGLVLGRLALKSEQHVDWVRRCVDPGSAVRLARQRVVRVDTSMHLALSGHLVVSEVVELPLERRELTVPEVAMENLVAERDGVGNGDAAVIAPGDDSRIFGQEDASEIFEEGGRLGSTATRAEARRQRHQARVADDTLVICLREGDVNRRHRGPSGTFGRVATRGRSRRPLGSIGPRLPPTGRGDDETRGERASDDANCELEARGRSLCAPCVRSVSASARSAPPETRIFGPARRHKFDRSLAARRLWASAETRRDAKSEFFASGGPQPAPRAHSLR